MNGQELQSLWYQANAALPQKDPRRRAAVEAYKHRNTPSTVHFDPLGRPVVTLADNTVDGGATTIYTTRAMLDIQGNQLALTDAKAIAWDPVSPPYQTIRQRFDMLGLTLEQKNQDSGDSQLLASIDQRPVYSKDARGYVTAHAYDDLRRPTTVTVTNPNGVTTYLAEQVVYGDDPAIVAALIPRTPQSLNLIGKPYQQRDGAGILTDDDFDFKGNLLHSTRQLLAGWTGTPDWTSFAGDSNGRFVFASQSAYDALNRPTQMSLPRRRLDGTDNQITLGYGKCGELSTVTLQAQYAEAKLYVTGIDYDEKGQRLSIGYGNGVTTTYTYEPATFRLSTTTTISPTRAFSESYRGVLVEFRVRAGTTEELASIGVRDTAPLTRSQYPQLPVVSKGWATRSAFFKTETLRSTGVQQINIGLGRGQALRIFNNNIRSYNVIRR